MEMLAHALTVYAIWQMLKGQSERLRASSNS
jgi:hypothetical protein